MQPDGKYMGGNLKKSLEIVSQVRFKVHLLLPRLKAPYSTHSQIFI